MTYDPYYDYDLPAPEIGLSEPSYEDSIDMYDLVNLMYDSFNGLRILSQAMARSDHFEKKCAKITEELVDLRSNYDHDKTLEPLRNKLEKAEGDLRTTKRACDQLEHVLKEKDKTIDGYHKDVEHLEEEVFDTTSKCSTIAHRAMDETEQLLKPLIQHVKEAGMREVDEIWVEEGKQIAERAANRLAIFRQENPV